MASTSVINSTVGSFFIYYSKLSNLLKNSLSGFLYLLFSIFMLIRGTFYSFLGLSSNIFLNIFIIIILNKLNFNMRSWSNQIFFSLSHSLLTTCSLGKTCNSYSVSPSGNYARNAEFKYSSWIPSHIVWLNVSGRNLNV